MIMLRTERLIIRDHVEDDLHSHHRLFSNDRVMRYLQDIQTHSLEESRENLQNAMLGIDAPDRKRIFLRIEVGASRDHVGEIGYTVRESTPMGKLVEIGYFIFEACWGRGYTTEALHAVMRFAFENDGVFRIACGCVKDNRGSELVMQKCGMTKEAELKAVTWHEGMLRDRVGYRLLRTEWEVSQSA